MILTILETGAKLRESSALGGFLTTPDGDTIPCAQGPDVSGLARADNSAGLTFTRTRKVVVRKSELLRIGYAPESGHQVTLRGRNEAESAAVTLMIAPVNGVEDYNSILVALNLYDPMV